MAKKRHMVNSAEIVRIYDLFNQKKTPGEISKQLGLHSGWAVTSSFKTLGVYLADKNHKPNIAYRNAADIILARQINHEIEIKQPEEQKAVPVSEIERLERAFADLQNLVIDVIDSEVKKKVTKAGENERLVKDQNEIIVAQREKIERVTIENNKLKEFMDAAKKSNFANTLRSRLAFI